MGFGRKFFSSPLGGSSSLLWETVLFFAFGRKFFCSPLGESSSVHLLGESSSLLLETVLFFTFGRKFLCSLGEQTNCLHHQSLFLCLNSWGSDGALARLRAIMNPVSIGSWWCGSLLFYSFLVVLLILRCSTRSSLFYSFFVLLVLRCSTRSSLF